MYYAIYDRNLNSIGSTYILESWSRIQRSLDFDDMKITGEQLPASANPYFVVVNDKQGHTMFSGLASTPSNDSKTKKSTIILKDYLTLLNSDIVVDWSTFKGTTVSDFLDFVLGIWKTQNGSLGFDAIEWDNSWLPSMPLDENIDLKSLGTESVLAYDLIHDCMSYYGVWCDPELNVAKKKLVWTFKRTAIEERSIRLKDFDIPRIEKSFGEYNKVSVYSHKYVFNQSWILTEDNRVVKEPVSIQDEPVYPTKNRNFIAEEPTEDLTEAQAINNAVYDAVMGLSQNRYQENIDLDIYKHKTGQYLDSATFSTTIMVYDEDGRYKSLPVGEIETDSKGKHILRIGYRIQELTQEL